jgi:hypothetical protein
VTNIAGNFRYAINAPLRIPESTPTKIATTMPKIMEPGPLPEWKKAAAIQEEMDNMAPIDISTPRPRSMAAAIPSAIMRSREVCLATLNRLSIRRNASDIKLITIKIAIKIKTYEYLAKKAALIFTVI